MPGLEYTQSNATRPGAEAFEEDAATPSPADGALRLALAICAIFLLMLVPAVYYRYRFTREKTGTDDVSFSEMTGIQTEVSLMCFR